MRAAAFALVLLAGTAEAAEIDLETGHRFFGQSIADELLESRLQRFPSESSSDRASYQLYLRGDLTGRPSDALGLRLGIDSGLIEIHPDGVTGDGRPIEDHLRETLLLGEVALELELLDDGMLQIRAGRLEESIAKGAVYDAYGFGASFDLDLSIADVAPFRARLVAGVPDGRFILEGKQPMVAVELGYVDRDFEALLFGATYFDTGDGLAPFLDEAVLHARLRALAVQAGPRLPPGFLAQARRLFASQQAYALETHGVLGWTGAVFSMHGEAGYLSARAILEVGRLDLKVTPSPALEALASRLPERFSRFLDPIEAPIAFLGGFADLDGGVQVADPLLLGGFVVFLTGEDDRFTRDDPFSGFVSLEPRFDYTSIFFGGGVATVEASPQIVSLAPDAAGLIAGGLRLELTPLSALRVEAVGAMFAALETTPIQPGRIYGFEADLVAGYEILEGFEIQVDSGVFQPGDYYSGVPAAFQLIAGFGYKRRIRP